MIDGIVLEMTRNFAAVNGHFASGQHGLYVREQFVVNFRESSKDGRIHLIDQNFSRFRQISDEIRLRRRFEAKYQNAQRSGLSVILRQSQNDFLFLQNHFGSNVDAGMNIFVFLAGDVVSADNFDRIGEKDRRILLDVQDCHLSYLRLSSLRRNIFRYLTSRS